MKLDMYVSVDLPGLNHEYILVKTYEGKEH